MATITPVFDDSLRGDVPPAGLSAVSWPAVFAGATAAAALSLILLVLGTGLGLTVVSPWATQGASAEAISWSTILWIAFCAIASSGLGGYIAGRLRVKWSSVHGDEVYFRDTAHGFLAWAVATLITAAALTSVIGAILNAGASAAANVAAGGVQAVGQAISAGTAPSSGKDGSSSLYAVESLFRTAPVAEAPINPATRAAPAQPEAALGNVNGEIARIFDNGIHDGPLSAEDTRYVGQIVAQRTGLSQPEAEARVTTIYTTAQQKLQQAETEAKELADQARKAGAYTALWIFVSLLSGAFFASLMATVGGRQRDQF